MFVKPCEGRAARDPTSRALLAADGEEKPDTRFWRRRVRDKDVEEVKRPVDVEPEPKAEEVKPADQVIAENAARAEAKVAEQAAAAPAEEH
jgi:hypothetical protein